MSARVEIPFPPRPAEPPPGVGRMEPPWVPIEPRWEYRELVRDLASEALPTVADLNAMGDEHWELAGIAVEGRRVHFYFKRERIR